MALFRMKPWYRKRVKVLSYYGTASNLTYVGPYTAATTVGNYALFAGGLNSSGSNLSNYLDYYNKSLVKGYRYLVSSFRDAAATTVGNYALFAGGQTTGSGQHNTYLIACNESLTITNTTNYDLSYTDMAATTIGNYGLFAGGSNFNQSSSSSYYGKHCSSVDTSLTVSNLAYLSRKRPSNAAATTVGDYAIFAGGVDSSEETTNKKKFDIYDNLLTKINNYSLLTNAGFHEVATTIGNYGLFAGSGDVKIGIMNNSLTYSEQSYTNHYYDCGGATTLDKYAIFACGGEANNTSALVIDDTLTSIVLENVVQNRNYISATTVGNYALFAGGSKWNSSTYKSDDYKIVNVFQVT